MRVALADTFSRNAVASGISVAIRIDRAVCRTARVWKHDWCRRLVCELSLMKVPV